MNKLKLSKTVQMSPEAWMFVLELQVAERYKDYNETLEQIIFSKKEAFDIVMKNHPKD